MSCRFRQDQVSGGTIMSESKQYITQKQENGSVMISEEVIAVIVEHAVTEVEGVAGLAPKPGADIADLIGKKNWGKGMKIVIAEDNSMTIDCNVTIAYGHSVVGVAGAVQNAVRSAVESMTGEKVESVNVNVCGILRR